MKYVTLTPAYGRDYTSKRAAQADFDADLDFRIQPTNQLVNRSQLAELGVDVANIRSADLRKVWPVKVRHA